ncbi:type VI secretion system baseplate subunit TssK [Klebsiella variicola]|nr:type VI secretion system baseplate subunit TssK [Klebsiella variicola]
MNAASWPFCGARADAASLHRGKCGLPYLPGSASGARCPGQWIVDPEFIPPLLSLAASPTLVSELGELLHRLQARRRRLMAMRRESNARMADFAVADVSLFWLLNALNSAEPVLSELHQDPSRHPELLYRELARLAGSLMTFSLEHHLEAIPRYRHASPEQVFPPLFALLDTLPRSQPALKGDRHRSGAGRRPGDLAGQAARCATARGGGFLSVGALFTPH